jgi:NAD(P)-dependent dehydrogenase (short-subunit alcohol dehydrogenase family)
MSFFRKSILVTGAASGIGRACADLLLQRWAKVDGADLADIDMAYFQSHCDQLLIF